MAPSSRRRWFLAAAALWAAALSAPSGARADEPDPLAATTEAVEKAEKDPADVTVAKAAVDAAIAAQPTASAPRVLAARVAVVEWACANRADDKKKALAAAFAALSKAQELGLRDPAPYRVRIELLTKTGAAKDELVEALRSLAVRLPGDKEAREAFTKQTGKVPQLKVGDPFPMVTWKNSRGEDVAADTLWREKPVVIELVRSVSWCEYCRRRLAELHDKTKEFDAEKASVVAISSDAAEVLAGVEKDGLKTPLRKPPFLVRLLSDPKGEQADKLGLLNPESVKPDVRPEAFGLAHPTTIVVDTNGIVRFIETHEDFKIRTKVDVVIGALRRLNSPIAPR